MCYIKWGVIRNYKDSRNYDVKKKKRLHSAVQWYNCVCRT